MPRSKVNYVFDADTAFTGPANVTPTTASGNIGTRVALDKMVAARADGALRDKLGAEGYAIVIAVTAAKVTVADEAYTFNVQGTDAAGGNAITVGSVAIPAGAAIPGQYVIKVDAATLDQIAANVSDVELNLAVVVAGTAPSVTVGAAWMAYDRNA
jgi:hypothetical protein